LKLSLVQRAVAGLALFAGVLAADQISKWAVETQLFPGQSHQPIPALAPFFQITRTANTGAAFGLFDGMGDVFLILAVVVVTGLAIWYPRITPEGHWRRVAVALIAGGAIGNALDRIEYGHVVDFIHYQIPGLISNVSNLADHAIVGGIIILMIATWVSDRQQTRLAAAPVEAGLPRDERSV
jgi:signal peptidase II